MSDSPPHQPAPFPYIWPGANPVVAPTPAARYNFAFTSSKRARTPEVSDDDDEGDEDGSSEEEDLDDPFDLAPRADNEMRPSGSGAHQELQETNKGMQMLLKLGWSQGKGLGKELQGRVTPVDPGNNSGMMGLGKAALDTRMLDSTTLTTKRLESEKIAKETPDQRKARMDKAAYKKEVEAEIAATLQKFRCEICDKSYQNVGQYDEHTNSYDHHHRARAIALKNAAREKSNASGESEKRREKERKREAKELAKLMGASGVPVKGAAVGIIVKPDAKPESAELPKEEKKAGGGWAKFGAFAPVGGGSASAKPELKPAIAAAATPSVGGFKKVGGWASSSFAPVKAEDPVASTSSSSAIPSTSAPPPAFRSGGTMSLSKEVDAQTYDHFSSKPTSRNGDSSTMEVDQDSRSTAPLPLSSYPGPRPPMSAPPPPPPPPPSTAYVHPPPPSSSSYSSHPYPPPLHDRPLQDERVQSTWSGRPNPEYGSQPRQSSSYQRAPPPPLASSSYDDYSYRREAQHGNSAQPTRYSYGHEDQSFQPLDRQDRPPYTAQYGDRPAPPPRWDDRRPPVPSRDNGRGRGDGDGGRDRSNARYDY